jgi:arylsulfatase A-like enzyme
MASPLLSQTNPNGNSRPNILFLLSDDQRADLLGVMGHPVLQTPNIDRLARQGVLFRNNFCSTAICCTSRASLLSGLYEKCHGVSNFAKPLSPEVRALSYPELLRQAGYRTCFTGKYGVGGNGAPKADFDVSFGDPGLERAGQSRAIGRQAMDFLDQATANQPFCLCVHFRAPHARDNDPAQYLYDPEEASLYRGQQMPVSPKTAATYFDRLPEFVKNSESRVRWQKRFTNPEHYQESVRSYFRLISGVDTVVGQIREKLAQKGLEGNTIIIYSSDNGYFLAERGLADKWYAYEESIRTPLIIFDPRQPQTMRGKQRTEMTLNIDISPTILDAAGLKVPPSVQGRSLLPLVAGAKPAWRKEWFYSHLFPATPPTVVIPKSEGLRTERWKYIRWSEAQPAVEEVYDLRRDPQELVNLVSGAQRPKLEERWKLWNNALGQWRADQPWQEPRA